MNLALRLLSLAPAAALAASANAQFSHPQFAVATASGPPVCSVATPTGIVTFRVDGLGASGVNVAMGDVNDDGIADVIVGAGPGAPGGHVKVFSGLDGSLLHELAPFGNSYTGATYVAAGTVLINSTRVKVFLCASDAALADGGGQVRLIETRSGGVVFAFNPFPEYQGGVRIAAADLNGDGFDEIIAAPDRLHANASVRVFDGAGFQGTGVLLLENTTISGSTPPPGGFGRDVLVGGLGSDHLNGGHPGGILVALGDGSVRVLRRGVVENVWYPFGPNYTGGISVAAGDINGDGQSEVIAGTLASGSVTFVDTATGQPVGAPLQPFGPSFLGGINVAAAPPRRCPGADFDRDGDVGTDADVEAFFACLGGNCCATCGSADFNGDGDVGTDADIEAFFRVLAGGAC